MNKNKTKRLVLIIAAAILIPLAVVVGALEVYGITGEQDLEKPGPCSNAALSRCTDQQSTGLSTVKKEGLSVFRHPRRSVKGVVV